MSWKDKDLGPVDAYAFAVENGYFSGTREQWYAMISGTTQNASDAEAYAKGTRAGEAVASDDPAYHNNSSYWNDQAGDNAENAEAWANGTRDGVDVTSGDPAYEKNSKYWEGQAALQKAAAQAAAETASAAYNVNLLAPNYDATSTYAVGAHVIYSGGYYECISAITTAEEWTAAHWRQLTVGGEAGDLKNASSNINGDLDTYTPDSKMMVSEILKDEYSDSYVGRKMIVVSGVIGYAVQAGIEYRAIPIEKMNKGFVIKYSDLDSLGSSASNVVAFGNKGKVSEAPTSYEYLSVNNIKNAYKGIVTYDQTTGIMVLNKATLLTKYPSTTYVYINLISGSDVVHDLVYINDSSVNEQITSINEQITAVDTFFKSKLYSEHNVMGNTPGVYYPINAPAGSTFKAITYMAKPLESTVQILLYNSSKEQVDYFGLVKDANGRTYQCPPEKGAISYIGINASPSVPIQVEISSAESYSPFQFYILTDELFSEKIIELDTRITENETDIEGLDERLTAVEEGGASMPSFVRSAGYDAFKRIITWADSEPFAMIAQVTDVHSAGTEKYKAVGQLNSLNSLFGFDLIGNFGDIGLDTETETESNGWELVENTKVLMDATSPWVFLRGNHDHGRVLRLTNGSMSNIFEMPFAKQNRLMHETGECYGYIDLETMKIRVVYVNTSDARYYGGYGLTTTQLSWIANTLAETETGWDVVIISHQCVDPCGRWNNYPNDATGDDFDTFRSIMAAFVAKTAGSNAETGVSWDFTNVPADCKLVCNFAGDSHFNNTAVTNGVRYIVRQGYGGISVENIADGGTRDDFNYTQQCLFDVLCIKKDGTAGVFRIGAGGSTRDMTFTY